MQVELKTLQRTVGITTIHVTHDQEEALTLADRVAILNHGRVEQVGAPRDVYARPANVFVADFLGKANFLVGQIATATTSSASLVVRTEVGDLLADPDGERPPEGSAVDAFVRPERIELRRPGGAPADNALPAQVERVVFSGATVSVEVRLAAGRLLTADQASGGPAEQLTAGQPVTVVIPPSALRVTRRTGAAADGR
jgi:ABC-type Fe3+/spermidine/putrescine transport system ATPase subunit